MTRSLSSFLTQLREIILDLFILKTIKTQLRKIKDSNYGGDKIEVKMFRVRIHAMYPKQNRSLRSET